MTNQLNIGDAIVIIAYFVAMILVGVYFSKKIKNNDSFAVADRSLSLPVVIGTTVATCMGAGTALGDVGYMFEVGLVGIVSVAMWNVGWIGQNVMAKSLRASGVSSLPEFLEHKYGKSTRNIAAFVLLVMVANSTAAQFKAGGTILETLGILDIKTGIIIGGIIIILFTLFGGLYSVAVTDTIHCVVIFIGVAIIVPIVAFYKAGGVGEVFSKAATETPEMLSWDSIPIIVLVGYALSYLLAAGSHPAYAQRILAAKDTKTAVRGSIWANIFSFIIEIPVLLVPLTAFIILPNLANGEMMVPSVVATFFPPILKGLVLAGLIALIVTTADSFLLLLATTISSDIIPIFKQDVSDKTSLLISRVVVVVGGILAIILAINGGGVFQLFRMGSAAYGAAMFVPLILGCFWKRARTKAINVGMVLGCVLTILWNQTPLYESTEIEGVIIGALACLIICVAGSLLIKDTTKPQVK